jgi:Protein of unknown function (DUF2442)
MKHPKIISARAIDNNTLKIEFDNSIKKTYDIRRVIDREMFMPLKNYSLFQNVQIDNGGYAVFWNEDIDISEYELWTNGENC